MRNEKGGAIVIAMVLVVLVSVGIVTTVHVSQNMVDSAARQTDALEKERLESALKTVFGDQRFCGEFFPQGLSTQEGSYDLTPGNTMGYAKAKLEELEDIFAVYRPGSIRLTDRTDLPVDENGVQYSRFNVSISIVPRAGFFGRIGAAFGQAKEGVFGSKNLRLLVGSNNRCYVEGFDVNANTEMGVASGCKALGGVYENGRCNMSRYQSEFDGMIDTSKPLDVTSSNFADALCAMELDALRKMGPHLINQSTAATTEGKSAYGWTSLCAKPKWIGCRVSQNPDEVLQGNVETSETLLLPGQTWTTSKKKMNADNFDDHLEEVAKPTITRRFNRVTGIVANETGVPLGYGIGDHLDMMFGNMVNSGKTMVASLGVGAAVGAGAYAYATTAALASTLSAAWVAGPVGIATAVVFKLIMPKCKNIRAEHTFQCVEGYPELTLVKWERQKLKIGLSGIKCKWKEGGEIPIPTEADIYSLVKGKGLVNNIITEEDLEAQIEGVQDVITQLQDPDLTLAELLAMFYEDQSDLEDDEEVLDYNIPEQLVGPLTEKELQLWAKFYNDAVVRLATMTIPPRAQLATETPEAYATFLRNFYRSRASQITALAAETQNYVDFSKSIKNPDGSIRNFSATQTYSTYVGPLISRIITVGDQLKSDSLAAGIDEFQQTTFAVSL